MKPLLFLKFFLKVFLQMSEHLYKTKTFSSFCCTFKPRGPSPPIFRKFLTNRNKVASDLKKGVELDKLKYSSTSTTLTSFYNWSLPYKKLTQILSLLKTVNVFVSSCWKVLDSFILSLWIYEAGFRRWTKQFVSCSKVTAFTGFATPFYCNSWESCG